MILAIDPSVASTGYCVFHNNKLIKYGNIPTDKNDFDNEDDRLNYIGDVIFHTLKEYDVKVVVMENQFIGNNVTTGMLLKKLSGVLCRVCKDINEVVYYTPAQWRKILGINKSKDKKQGMESKNQPTADFINIVAWGKSAENCANYLVKGRLVGIQGRIQTSNYDDKDGKKVYVTEVVASNIEFLEWGDKQQNNSDFGGIDGFHPTDSDDSIPF